MHHDHYKMTETVVNERTDFSQVGDPAVIADKLAIAAEARLWSKSSPPVMGKRRISNLEVVVLADRMQVAPSTEASALRGAVRLAGMLPEDSVLSQREAR